MFKIPKTQKLLNLTNDFGKVAGYKINTHKSMTLLCTNHETSEKEICKEHYPIQTASKPIKYLVINLTKEVKDLYTENYKILFQTTRTETEPQKWRSHGGLSIGDWEGERGGKGTENK